MIGHAESGEAENLPADELRDRPDRRQHHDIGDIDRLRRRGLGRDDRPCFLRLEQNILRALDNARSRSEEHTSELQSLMRISYAVFCLKKKIEPKQQLNYTKRVNEQ